MATLAVVAALMSSTLASGQDYTFGDWARDQGYSPGDVMPSWVDATWDWPFNDYPTITSLDGIGEFDWTTTPTTALSLEGNQITRIESGAFSGLTNLRTLYLGRCQISSIESGAFSGLTDLTELWLDWNLRLSRIESGAFSELTNLIELSLAEMRAMRELNLEAAGFSSLLYFDVGYCCENTSSVSLRNAAVNQTALAALFHGVGPDRRGIGDLQYHGAIIAKMDLSGIDFGNVTDLGPLYAMDDLTDLWLVDTANLDATDLDSLLDNLETIEGTDTEGILYMTRADFDAFNDAGEGLLAAWHGEPGHHVVFGEPLLGDLNIDGEVNGMDVDPFVDVLLNGLFWLEADMNADGRVNGLDVDPFVVALDGGGAQQIPEPSTLLLGLIALGVVGGWRKWRR